MAQEMAPNICLTKEVNIKKDLLKQSRYQTRIEIFEDPEDLQELAENIKKNGLLNRPLVRVDPDEPDKFELIGGHRRTNAMVNILEWETIPCRVIDGLDEITVCTLVLSENLQANSLTHYEEGKAFGMMRLYFKFSLEKIAKHVDRSLAVVRDRMELADEMDRAREAYGAPDYYKYILRVTQPIRELINELFDLGIDYAREGIQRVVKGETVDQLKVFVEACKRVSKSENRDINAEIAKVEREEKRRSKADAVKSMYNWHDRLRKKVPKELREEFDKGRNHIEFLAAEREQTKGGLDKYPKASHKKVSCPKCHLGFQVSQTSSDKKTLLVLKPKDKKLQKEIITIQLTLDV